ncbi:ribosomal protection-like ABC-F family protein [Dethiothermospora halolimnae]|uniref:ribosomal protection-like ABC-F family protein n=1 Tax=Dethiothermospora halolimnae TaxID=3114390 RepID=UPI003CCB8CB5
MHELSLDGVKKYMDATLVLRNVSFQVSEGERVGIIGQNGGGKTTILKLIAGIIKLRHCIGYPYAPIPPGYDEGWVKISKGTRCAYLEQMPEYPEGIKVIEVLKMAFKEICSIEKEMRQLEEKMKVVTDNHLEKALKRYSHLMELYKIKGGYDTEEKLSRIITGLNFDKSFLNKDFSVLSEGEKIRVILGKLLIDNPDVLLLDEPTNHLDMESIQWLESYLRSYDGIVIAVSHDRYFLDNVVNKIIEIEDKEAITYNGNYSSYLRQKEENMRIQYEHFREQKKKINSMENKIKKLRDWAMRADNNKFFRRAASIKIKLDKMDRVDKPIFQKRNMKLNIETTHRSGKETVKAIGLSKKFKDKVIFRDADLMVRFGERVALIGPNGSGKTTFLKMLLGKEKPDEGLVKLGASVSPAYLPQQITFSNEELTILECFREDIFIPEGEAREYLSKYMFYGKDVFKKLKHLSGGEKIRLKLAQLLYKDINLLILDEPTNHLDIDSIETFEEALEDFNGTILFISHDRYFINKVSERVIAIENNAFKSYLGNYDYYKSVKEQLKLKFHEG